MKHAPRASFSVVNILAGSQWMLLTSHCASRGDMPPIKTAVNRILFVKVLLFFPDYSRVQLHFFCKISEISFTF